MARGFSKAIITGNVVRDPELRTTSTGSTVCGFAIAVNRTYKDAGGNNVENVSFIDCSAWGKIGEVIHQYAKKGSGMLVSGRLDQRSWEDKDSGQKRSRVEIVVEDFNFLGDGGGRGNGGGGGGGATTEFASPEYSAPASRKSNDVAPTDIDDGPIDLSEIPF